jgi:hypothetical protein
LQRFTRMPDDERVGGFMKMGLVRD